MTNNSNDKKDYKIGYGKPPRDKQFKKGVSGNPKGRPKNRPIIMRKEEISEIFLNMLREPVSYNRNNEQVVRPYYVALIEKLKADALKGDRYARKYILERAKDLMEENYEDKIDWLRSMLEGDEYFSAELFHAILKYK